MYAIRSYYVVSLLLAVILAHSLIGPFGRWIGDGVGWAAKTAMTGSFAPIGAALFGFLYAPLVITGVHHTTNAVDLQLMQSMGGRITSYNVCYTKLLRVGDQVGRSGDD